MTPQRLPEQDRLDALRATPGYGTFEAHVTITADLLSPAEVRAVLDDPACWESARPRAKWEKFRKATACDIPEDLPGIAAGVVARLPSF